MVLATLVTAMHARPFQALPMIFPPVLVLSSYMNVAGYVIDSAGLTAAWSGMYVLLALRRRQPSLRHKFTVKGLVRGTAMGLGTANCIAGGATYLAGNRQKEAEERREKNRWGNQT